MPPTVTPAPGEREAKDWSPGVSRTAAGTRFAVESQAAEQVWLCLFGRSFGGEEQRVPMEALGGGRWQATVEHAGPGTLYGYRVEGPYDPARGLLCHPGRLLFDPYARDYRPAAEGNPGAPVAWDSSLFPVGPRSRSPAAPSEAGFDTAPLVPLARIPTAPPFDWGEHRHPAVPWRETVIYELHVKGMTALHPLVPAELRGTFLGLAQAPVLDHLRRLGVTAVELMPIAFSLTEPRLADLGLTNYWGYNPLGFSAPDRRFCATDDPVTEVKTMVRAFHEAGIEVILDVVYNHSAEGGREGPVLSLKGLDNGLYYRLKDQDRGHYENFSGCGNTLDVRRPAVRRLALDSLRTWVREYRVDGFRFDLAPSLGRTGEGFDGHAPFFEELQQEPDLRRLKLVAEPWDLGPGGYALGRFPSPWREWNDRYRDSVRSFWRGDGGAARLLARRLTGSSSLFRSGSRPVNLVTCHDGFTLQDLVSYEEKRNEANGEGGRDGHELNFSRSWGEEGPTEDPTVLETRRRVKRALLATLFFSRGTPMVSHGDELGRSQQGNNNAYCQDGPLTWVPWPEAFSAEDSRQGDAELWGRLARIRKKLLIPFEKEVEASRWLGPSGEDLTEEDWHDPDLTCFGWWFPGSALLLFNAGSEDRVFRHAELTAADRKGGPWHLVLDSSAEDETAGDRALEDEALGDEAFEEGAGEAERGRPGRYRWRGEPGAAVRLAAHSLQLWLPVAG